MDISEIYIKMCEKAEEIKKLKKHIFIEGDYCHCKECGNFIHSEGRLYDFDGIVWLPRQDQLQEMIGDKYPVPWVLAKAFARKVYWTSADTAMSMEQLWLTFVMKEKYYKTWDGEEWTTTK